MHHGSQEAKNIRPLLNQSRHIACADSPNLAIEIYIDPSAGGRQPQMDTHGAVMSTDHPSYPTVGTHERTPSTEWSATAVCPDCVLCAFGCNMDDGLPFNNDIGKVVIKWNCSTEMRCNAFYLYLALSCYNDKKLIHRKQSEHTQAHIVEMCYVVAGGFSCAFRQFVVFGEYTHTHHTKMRPMTARQMDGHTLIGSVRKNLFQR